jgi:hypothetical protein
MGAYTNQHGSHYDEKHVEYLSAFSKASCNQADFRASFVTLAEAIRNGQLPRGTVPEGVKPEN